MIRSLGDRVPKLDPSVWVSEAAYVCGDVTIGAGSSVWPGAVIRGDFCTIVIGENTHIEDNCVVHGFPGTDTVIEEGVILDNQIQIGHNCHVGAHTAMAGCVGVAGSAIIGKYCTFGGAAMVLGHLTIADRVHVGSGSMVSRSIAEPGQYTGFYPLAKNADWEKSAAIVRNLSSMREKIRALEKTIKTLTTQDEK